MNEPVDADSRWRFDLNSILHVVDKFDLNSSLEVVDKCRRV